MNPASPGRDRVVSVELSSPVSSRASHLSSVDLTSPRLSRPSASLAPPARKKSVLLRASNLLRLNDPNASFGGDGSFGGAVANLANGVLGAGILGKLLFTQLFDLNMLI
jgi:hypothetical protein